MQPTAQAVGVLFLKSPSPEGRKKRTRLPSVRDVRKLDSATCNVQTISLSFTEAELNRRAVTPVRDHVP